MPPRSDQKAGLGQIPWLTAEGYLDISRLPIDNVLRQALSADDVQFRSGCNLLRSMLEAGRTEAGVFLLGLLTQYPENYARLTVIAEMLAAFKVRATVDVLAAELRRVKGTSATRAYLRRIIDTLAGFPAQLAEDRILALSTDPQVGPRFREHLQDIANRLR
ncbi:MAG TPA: hypothetical protein VFL86_14950 [Burkholderiaceae bacterium]|nr:hypothetical protein [Burkholderiaceae bacterium]